jgi:hypothetical protein
VADSSSLTPLQWLERLGPMLVERQDRIAYWRRYYEGDQDLPSGPQQHLEAYKRFQSLARTNLCGLCAESMVHRTQAIGFRDNSGPMDAEPDNAVWDLWQAARLDARQYSIWRKAFSRSAAYVTVGVDPRRAKVPRVTIEGPENVIVETDPADPQNRLAALRLWFDSIEKRWMATIYLPGERYHWQTTAQASSDPELSPMVSLRFDPNKWERRGEPGRSLPVVPVIPFENADEGEDPVAAFDVGTDVQDRLNLTILNRLTSERYAAFRQRYLTNYNLENDPATGLPIAPFKPGVDQLWVTPPPEPGEPPSVMGDFAQTDTSMMLRAVEADMRSFAAITITPVYYLPGDLVNIGADSIAALDAGHIAKCKQAMAWFGEGLEEMLQLMADVAELDRDLSTSEIVWARPENFRPAAMADYLSKLTTAGVPLPMVTEEIGWSPQRVEQLRAEKAADAFMAALAAPPAAAESPNGAVSGPA